MHRLRTVLELLPARRAGHSLKEHKMKKGMTTAVVSGAGIILVVAVLTMIKPPPAVPGIAPRSVPESSAAAFDFKKEVLESPLPVLVDFWAPWCGPCRMVSPVIEGIAAKTEGRVKVVKINVDDHPNIAREYNIRGIPTVMVFRNGAMEKSLMGAQSEDAYLKALGI